MPWDAFVCHGIPWDADDAKEKEREKDKEKAKEKEKKREKSKKREMRSGIRATPPDPPQGGSVLPPLLRKKDKRV